MSNGLNFGNLKLKIKFEEKVVGRSKKGKIIHKSRTYGTTDTFRKFLKKDYPIIVFSTFNAYSMAKLNCFASFVKTLFVDEADEILCCGSISKVQKYFNNIVKKKMFDICYVSATMLNILTKRDIRLENIKVVKVSETYKSVKKTKLVSVKNLDCHNIEQLMKNKYIKNKEGKDIPQINGMCMHFNVLNNIMIMKLYKDIGHNFVFTKEGYKLYLMNDLGEDVKIE